jgi:hypothetical protein
MLKTLLQRIRSFFFAPSLGFVLVALVILGGIDLVLRAETAERFNTGLFRVPVDSVALLTDYAEHFQNNDGLKIAFLGDSTTRGDTVPQDTDAIPAQAGRSLSTILNRDDLLAANFGISAGQSADSYLVACRLGAAPALIVYPVNIKFFSGLYPESVRFPELAAGFEKNLAGLPDVIPAPKQQAKHLLARIDGALTGWLRSNWFMLRNKDWVVDRLFGNHPKRRVRQLWAFVKEHGARSAAKKVAQGHVNVFQWSDRNWTETDKASIRETFEIKGQLETNVNYRYLLAMAETARNNGVPFLAYAPPINNEFADRFDLIDRDRYRSYFTRIEKALAERGARFAMLDDAVPSEYFRDMDHLIGPGNSLLAERIAILAAEMLNQEAP